MGTPRQHFGHDPKAAGRRTAEQLAAGEITAEEAKQRYKDAKDIGYGDEYREGFAEGAENP